MRREILSRLRDSVRRLLPGEGPGGGADAGAAAPAPDAVVDRFAAVRRLQPGHLVTITTHGASLLLLPQAIYDVQLPALAVLEELSRRELRPLNDSIHAAQERSGADRFQLAWLIASIEDAGLLTERPAGPARPHPASVPLAASAVAAPDALLTIAVPRTLVVEDGAFLWFDHAGGLQERLRAEEVDALLCFLPARRLPDAYAAHVERRGERALARDVFEQLADRLRTTGLLVDADTLRSNRADPVPFIVGEQAKAIQARFLEAIAARPPHPAPGPRTPVVPVSMNANVRPLSLGLLLAHAMQYDGGRLADRWDFVPLFLCDEELLAERARTPSIFLFSNYLWCLEENLKLSALVKRINPDNVTIHGGPSTPKYEGDAQRFFDEHPHVDVTVRGEGEQTFVELLDALDSARPWDLRPLADVPGLTFRTPTGLVRTPDRARLTELDVLPSPYLLGLFEPFGTGTGGAIIETNRGCPYGCTFCDWGSATLSKVRQFSLDRVFAELEWSASHHIEVCALADANFGIIERDVLIAEKIAELKRRYGYPRILATNYAKNTVKHLRRIIEVLTEVKVLTEGVVSLQSMDAHTLAMVKRSNIKLEQYDALTTEFRRAGIPLAADIMMGLPGATPAAFRNDLQQCVNRDVTARVNYTQLLPNSPMNDPAYREKHGITAGHGEILRETSSYTRAEWDEMARLREAFSLFDTWGVLRYVAAFVRSETGLNEVGLYDRLQAEAHADPQRWPILWGALRMVPVIMAPPASWGLFLDDVHDFLVTRLQMRDDAALHTALRVQRAHLPAPERVFPETVALAHDYVAWYRAVHEAREAGHRDDWETVVRPLRDYPPGELIVDDPHHICRVDVGKSMGLLAMAMQNWEFDSPVSRPRMRTLSNVRPGPGTSPRHAEPAPVGAV